MRAAVFSLGLCLISVSAVAQTTTKLTPISLPELPLAEVTYPGGKHLRLNVGIGSAAYRDPKDPEGVIYTITDRGPNLDCDGIEKVAELDSTMLCAGDTKAKNFPIPGFNPAIYKLKIDTYGTATVEATIPLKGLKGEAITGLPNPLHKISSEAGYDGSGKMLSQDASGVDTEALVKLADGTFWIGEEYGSSLLQVRSDGTILQRLVPAGVEADYKDAHYPVRGALPAIIGKRALNRGIENLAVSENGKTLYVLMQSPLANPDNDAYKSSKLVRLWKIDAASRQIDGEYVYELDDPVTFALDNKKSAKKQNDVRLSEMIWLGGDKLLVIERISKTTKFYVIDLADASALPIDFDKPETSPSLEQISSADFAARKITPVRKTLLLSSDDTDGLPEKVEGVAVLNDREMLVFNDSDFGIEGASNVLVKVTFGEPVLK
jgi:hypothetical protein